MEVMLGRVNHSNYSHHKARLLWPPQVADLIKHNLAMGVSNHNTASITMIQGADCSKVLNTTGVAAEVSKTHL
jgi:hypothetical protein